MCDFAMLISTENFQDIDMDMERDMDKDSHLDMDSFNRHFTKKNR
jgi:hypothetical protein